MMYCTFAQLGGDSDLPVAQKSLLWLAGNVEPVPVEALPRISAASRWRSGHMVAVKVKTAGEVSTTDRPCGWVGRHTKQMTP